MFNDVPKRLVSHYESRLKQYGPTTKGMDWPNKDEAVIRYNAHIDLIVSHSSNLSAGSECSVLDLGCGVGILSDYLKLRFPNSVYTGVDLSEDMIAVAIKERPSEVFYVEDIFQSSLPAHDFVFVNGVLTEKLEFSEEEMQEFAASFLVAAYESCGKAMSFNAMSEFVDWKRDDLFHWSVRDVATFVRNQLSKNFTIRHDYLPYEFTVYVYK